jgi:hypothetical protein
MVFRRPGPRKPITARRRWDKFLVEAEKRTEEAAANAPHSRFEQCYKERLHRCLFSRQDLDRAVKYSLENDSGALQELLQERVVFTLPPGIHVYVEKSPLLSGFVRCRKTGNTTEFWAIGGGYLYNQSNRGTPGSPQLIHPRSPLTIS